MNFERINALFCSTIAPGYVAGGSLCALAYLQAVDEVHQGNVTYIGPPFTTPECRKTMKLDNEPVFIPERPSLSKVRDLLSMKSVDRLSPIADDIITKKAKSDGDLLVYINGERCGRLAGHANELGLKNIAIFQNFTPEYIRHQPFTRSILNAVMTKIALKNSQAAYKNSDFRLFLTEQDRSSYKDYWGGEKQNLLSRGDMYFAHKEKAPVTTATDKNNEFVICINANMSMKMNETGVLSFVNDIWPEVRAMEPRAKLILAGRYPLQSIMTAAAAFSDIEVYERPEPPEMEKIFARTSLCVASSSHGSGIKLRIAESLRRGIPVLAAPHSTRGYEMVSSEVLKTYTSTDQAASLIRDFMGESHDKLRETCIAEHEKYFSFETGVHKLRDVITKVLNGADSNVS